MAEVVAAKGIAAEKIAVIPNGVSSVLDEPVPEVVSEIRGSSGFVVLHAGNIGWAGPWDSILAAARGLDADCSLGFVGDGVWADKVREAGLRVMAFRPTEELASVMEAGDLQLVALRRGMEGLVVPSKTQTILSHGRPILAVAPERSEVARIVERWQCGLVADPDDPADISGKIHWARDHPDELAEMGKRALEASKQFRLEATLARYGDLVSEVHETRSKVTKA
jgi:glycosyltransferase involved in cell wall biosynthesis